MPTKSTASCASLLNAAAATGTGGPQATTTSGTGSAKASNTAAASGSKKSSAAHVAATTPFSFLGTGVGIYVLGLVILAGGAFMS